MYNMCIISNQSESEIEPAFMLNAGENFKMRV